MIETIKNKHLCLGCGLCSSLLGHDRCDMKLSDDGFYYPILKGKVDETVIRETCPGIRVHGNGEGKLWGRFLSVVEGWACDNDIRFHSSSGGVVSALAVYLLEEHKVDAILHVGISKESYLFNELKVSKSKEEVINNSQSRYAPALTLYRIKEILDSSKDNYAFIGKACDIAGVKNLIEAYPQYKSRFKLFISILCAGMPSYNATIKIWKLSGKENNPYKVMYRGDGWPGFFRAVWDDGTDFQLTYNESWGKILCKNLNFRCKICPDGIGTLADVSVGDSWNTKDGYPDFEEQDGRCLVISRSFLGEKLLQDAKSQGYIIISNPLDSLNIKFMQPGQYNRRKYAGWRILPVQIMSSFMLDFCGLGIVKNALTSNVFEGIRNMKGTFARYMRITKSSKA